MNYEQIRFESADGIARITLDRPDRLNSFTDQMHEEVRDALSRVASDGSRVLLLTGNGRGFCAGQDLSDRAVAPGAAPVDLGRSIEKNYRPLILTLRNLPMPVVCGVNGVAAGAGASIALACDLVIATRSASFVQAFARIGLIWKCVDDEAFAATIDALLAKLAVAPTRGLAAIKRVLHASSHNTLEAQLALECETQRELGQSDDYREGVAAFMEKRKPVFTGR